MLDPEKNKEFEKRALALAARSAKNNMYLDDITRRRREAREKGDQEAMKGLLIEVAAAEVENTAVREAADHLRKDIQNTYPDEQDRKSFGNAIQKRAMDGTYVGTHAGMRLNLESDIVWIVAPWLKRTFAFFRARRRTGLHDVRRDLKGLERLAKAMQRMAAEAEKNLPTLDDMIAGEATLLSEAAKRYHQSLLSDLGMIEQDLEGMKKRAGEKSKPSGRAVVKDGERHFVDEDVHESEFKQAAGPIDEQIKQLQAELVQAKTDENAGWVAQDLNAVTMAKSRQKSLTEQIEQLAAEKAEKLREISQAADLASRASASQGLGATVRMVSKVAMPQPDEAEETEALSKLASASDVNELAELYAKLEQGERIEHLNLFVALMTQEVDAFSGDVANLRIKAEELRRSDKREDRRLATEHDTKADGIEDNDLAALAMMHKWATAKLAEVCEEEARAKAEAEKKAKAGQAKTGMVKAGKTAAAADGGDPLANAKAKIASQIAVHSEQGNTEMVEALTKAMAALG